MVNDLPDFMSPRSLGGFVLDTSDAVVAYPFISSIYDMTPFVGSVIDFHNREVSVYYQLELTRVTGSPPGIHGLLTKIVAGPGDQGFVRIPTFDNTAQFSVSVLTGSATPLLDWQVRGIASWPSDWSSYGGTPRIVFDSSPYLANANATINAGNWYTGRVQITATSDMGGPAWINMRYFDYNLGAFADFAHFGVSNQTSGVPIELTYPPAPVKIVVNNGATAQSITVSVIPSASNGY